MQQYHNFLAQEGQCAKPVYWQEDKESFRENPENLKQTIAKIRFIVREFERLIEMSHSNIASTCALRNDINATAEQLRLSPIPLDSISLLKTPENDK